MKVLVTGIGGGGHGEQIFKALNLAPTRYDIIAADMNPVSKGLAEAKKGYLLPPASHSSYIDAVLKLCRQENIQVVFHGSEPELKALSQNRHVFAEVGIFLPINSGPVIDMCLNKARTFERLERNGFHVPRWAKMTADSQNSSLKGFPLPAVIKPSLGGGGSFNVFLAQTEKELVWFTEYLLGFCDEVVVQEYVGTPDDEYTVGVLCDLDGQLINSIALKRYILSSLSNKVRIPNLTSRKDLGPVLAISSGLSQGEMGRFPAVTGKCEQIALSLGSRGPLNIQCRLVKGKVYVFEINPRFSGTTSLRAMMGFNEPDILIRKHLLGENIHAHFSYREAVILRGLNEVVVDKTRPFAEARFL